MSKADTKTHTCEEIVPLYKIPYGGKFKFVGLGTIYIHHRGDGMYPWVRNDDTNEMENAYIGDRVRPVK